ncbi:MAG: hypothetical protein P1U88_00880 [Thalassobaculaceae bacterium]|nr:hypothetical protein [Thalassobaculaceae bacterium]
MTTLKKTAAVLLVGLFVLTQTPAAAVAQQASPAPAAPATGSSLFDPFWVLTVGAGTVGGWVAAGILTDGLIIPAYVATLAPRAAVGGAQMAGAAGPQMGAGMAGTAMATATAANHAVVSFVQYAGRVTGAVLGGMIADSWYR